ncbi:MAG: VRR-NUC domain-containing protein [Verrucomicrobiaceae bacterium]|nr:MAG: VRR-NUC domain-containing protein [Verrucomicrobiaceae bacterium]
MGPNPDKTMGTETEIQAAIRTLSRGNIRLFRNSSGLCECRGFPIHYGIPGKGGADLLGWTTVRIGPEHIGRAIAVFTSIEVKKPKEGPRENQEKWLTAVTVAGGIAGIAHSKYEAEQIISGF